MPKLNARNSLRTLLVLSSAGLAAACGYYIPGETNASRADRDSIPAVPHESDDDSSHRLQVGETATWVNNDSQIHTVTSDSDETPFDSGDLAPGKSFSQTFTQPGLFPYHCSLHDEKGAVRVVNDESPFRFTSDTPLDGDTDGDASGDPNTGEDVELCLEESCSPSGVASPSPTPSPYPIPSATPRPCPPPHSQQTPPPGCTHSDT